ncbi:MAG: exosortase B [Burkholderiaceae bacterium]
MDFVRHDPRNAAESPAAATLFPPGSDRIVLGLVFCGLTLLYLPTYWALSRTVWQNSDQSQGPLMLAASLWLLFDQRAAIAALPARSMNRLGGTVLGFGLLLYVVGRSQSIWLFEVGSQLFVWSALLLLFKGMAALRLAWFAVFFLIFMVPLPGPIVAAVTGPLKAGVSYVASELLFALGYPVSRAGVILTVGPYLILVADACAGLTSMFSLEAVGLLYLKIVKHRSAWRNALLTVLVVPIAFCANVVRVLVLVLVTYHLGDAAGRGFLHAFAGLVLFVVAIAMIFAVDHLIGFLVPKQREAAR